MVLSNQQLTQLEKQGIPNEHALAFLEASRNTNCIVVTRVPGEACKGLLEEKYDCKGFHIKGKSCNWGPMAGFICLDPLLNKNGVSGAAKNAHYHYISLTTAYEGEAKAGVTQICISDKRLEELQGNFIENISSSASLSASTQVANSDRLFGQAKNGKVTVDWMLEKDGRLWKLYCHLPTAYGLTQKDNSRDLVEAFQEELGGSFGKERKDDYIKVLEILKDVTKDISKNIDDKIYIPVMAMVNPHPPYKQDQTYLNALTGDYDLFAVWPHKDLPEQDDYRIAGSGTHVNNEGIIEAEKASNVGKVVGNISSRVYTVAQTFNSIMSSKGYKGNLIYHSDECGRPYVEDVDLPIAVFNYKDNCSKVITKVQDLADFIKQNQKFYRFYVNKGWRTHLLEEDNSLDLKDSEKLPLQEM